MAQSMSSIAASLGITPQVIGDPRVGPFTLNSLRYYSQQAGKTAPDAMSEFAGFATTTTTAAPTYTINSAGTVTEGNSLGVSIVTTNFGTGTLYYTITGTGITDSDFSSPSNIVTNGGSVSITNNIGSFTLGIASDGVTEGNQTFTISLRTGNTNGTIVATKNVVISDPAATTAAPTTATPTTAAPTTAAPTTAAPTTAAPTTAAPTTAAPTTAAPTTAAPTTAAPTTTTKPPLAITNGSVTCSGTTGTFTSTVSGGTTPYTFIAIASSVANAISAVNGSGTRFSMGSDLSRTWTNIANGTWYVAVRDTAGGQAVSSAITISCGVTTAAPTTAAPTTAAPTTAAPTTSAPTTDAPTTGAPTTGPGGDEF